MTNIAIGRRAFIASMCAAPAVLRAAPSSAYPTKPINLVVPFPPGGAVDVVARAVAKAMAPDIPQPLVVVNRPGASGALALQSVARAAPDGYTLALFGASTFRLPFTQPLAFDPVQDFTFIANLAEFSYGFTVPEESPWKSMQDLLDHARKNPGKVSVGTTGGALGYVALKRLETAAGVRFNDVPYAGAVLVNQAVAGGQLDAGLDAFYSAAVRTGRVRLLATLGEGRPPQASTVPTLKELGYDVVPSSTIGLAGPKGLDDSVVALLLQAVNHARGQPDLVKTMASADVTSRFMGPDEFLRFARQQTAFHKQMVDTYGLPRQ